MAYIGNKLADSYTSFAKQDFTTSATTSYTLDYPVANANEIALFINFVRQEPTTAYAASGTSLTLTSATSASDDMYCVFLGKAVQTVNPPAGSVGLSQLSATGTKDSTTFLRGDNTFASAGGTNTPAFKATASANQSIANNTSTKIEFDTEDFDTDSAYDTTNDKFTVPSGKAGKYFFNTAIRIASLGDGDVVNLRFLVNGTEVTENRQRERAGSAGHVVLQCSMIKALSVGDYVEVFASHDYGSSRDTTNTYLSFQGYKLVE